MWFYQYYWGVLNTEDDTNRSIHNKLGQLLERQPNRHSLESWYLEGGIRAALNRKIASQRP